MHDIVVRLGYREPLCPDSLFGHLVATAVPGVEEWRDGRYRRTLRLPGGPGIAELRPLTGAVEGRFLLADRRDLDEAVRLGRRMLDLDCDPALIDGLLAADPVLAPQVRANPGRRVPGTADADEFAIRAMLGQQISTAAARTHAARLVVAHGEPVSDPGGGLTHLFPRPGRLSEALFSFPKARADALRGLIEALATGTVDLGGDPGSARAGLAALPGAGPWTVETIAMRALGDADAFPATDLGVRLAAKELGLPATPAALVGYAERWRPWRAYAVQYLWGTGTHPITTMPERNASCIP